MGRKALGRKVAKRRSMVVEGRDQPLEKKMFQLVSETRMGEGPQKDFDHRKTGDATYGCQES
eukprot:7841555-Karenia_brevis.AAC.1